VLVHGAASVEAQLISGDARLEEIRGEVRLRNVSGDAHIVQTGAANTQLGFTSTSGDLEWRGACAAGCRIDARTTSGDVTMYPSSSSSFELSFTSHSGDLSDELQLAPLPSSGRTKRARLGKGEGLVEVKGFSGDLRLKR
jgi:hypothetical protein